MSKGSPSPIDLIPSCSACASPDVIAVQPGSEPIRGPGGILLARGTPLRAWCIDCHPSFRGRVAA